MYPKIFQPTDIEVFHINGAAIEVPKCDVKFQKWGGESVMETFGGKAIVSIEDKPMFAELAILKHFINDGWQARWIETYGKGKMSPIFISDWKDEAYKNQIHSPITVEQHQRLLEQIAERNNKSFSGCWDVFAWKDDIVIFAESKRRKNDSLRSTQNNWLDASLKSGLKPGNFLVVQWDFSELI